MFHDTSSVAHAKKAWPFLSVKWGLPSHIWKLRCAAREAACHVRQWNPSSLEHELQGRVYLVIYLFVLFFFLIEPVWPVQGLELYVYWVNIQKRLEHQVFYVLLFLSACGCCFTALRIKPAGWEGMPCSSADFTQEPLLAPLFTPRPNTAHADLNSCHLSSAGEKKEKPSWPALLQSLGLWRLTSCKQLVCWNAWPTSINHEKRRRTPLMLFVYFTPRELSLVLVTSFLLICFV